MSVSALFIRRPVTTTLLMSALVIFGYIAYRNLPVSDLPNVEFPVILVTAQLPGANPDTMASSVATPLERQFTTIEGLVQMTSSSYQGSTQITLLFDLAKDIDAAAQDVQAAIAAASPLLPANLPFPPTYRKVNPADQPILYMALNSTSLPLSKVDEYAQTLLAQRISMVSGVAQVLVFGAQKYAVRVQLDPDALAARQIGIDEVVSAVQGANVNLPTGILHGPHDAWTVESAGQLLAAEAYNPLIVAYRNGRPVRLEEIGRAIDSVQNDKTIAWYNDEPAIVLAVQKQPGANTVAVSRAIQELLPTFREEVPAAIGMQVLYDRAESIRESVDEVQFTLVLALLLVVLVVFLFLRNLTATVIPSLALPLSILGTFAVMWLLGYSLDNLSLLALTLSIGFVIDDAIVMLENIVRHLEMGKGPMQAAYDGAAEVGFTIVSMTISLAAVFIPVLFLGGIVGRLFREFSVTIATAILFSGVVALTLTPMVSGRFLRRRKKEPGWLVRKTEAAFDRSLRVYDRWLQWALRHSAWMMIFSALVLVLTFWVAAVLPKGFLPAEDTGQIFTFTEGPQSASFEYMARHQRALNQVFLEDPNVESLFSTVGAVFGAPPNTGIVFARLRPRDERVSVFEAVEGLRPKLDELTGIRAYPQAPPPLRLTGVLTKGEYQYTLTDPNRDRLYAAALAVEARLRELPQLLDVNSDLELRNPQLNVITDRDKAAALGLQMAQIETALGAAYGSSQISYIYTPIDTYQVIVEVLPGLQRFPQDLSRLWLRARPEALLPAGSTGAELEPVVQAMVPLEAVARLEPGVGPLSVNHTGQLPSVTISFNLAPGVSLGAAVEALEAEAQPLLPPETGTRFLGAAQAFQESFRELGVLLLLAILVIYLVLGILYESFIHPITILSALPFAGFGAFLTLLLFGSELNVYSFVGVIMLVGLVKKNGIMMVDFAIEAERREGLGSRDAIHQACLIRFRPIMMTTFAALMGTLPIALASGAGAESRRPLGLAVVGGLLFSQTLTLFVTPVFFLYMDRLQNWARRRRRAR